MTGFDLVRAQVEIAAGRPLRWGQDDVRLRGHAVECRLYAEDPNRDDLPAPGRLVRFQPPLAPGLRHDLGYSDGDVVPPFYDTMLGKLIAFGEDRASAIIRARTALDQYQVDGIPTNRALLGWILDHPTFRSGQATTDFLESTRAASTVLEPIPPLEAYVAAVALELTVPRPFLAGSGQVDLGDWRIGGQGIVTFWLPRVHDALVRAVADREDPRSWRVTIDANAYRAVVADAAAGTVVVRPAELTDRPDVPPVRCQMGRTSDGLEVRIGRAHHLIRRAPPPNVEDVGVRQQSRGLAMLEAPMPGRVVRIAVAIGDDVRERQPLVVVEAMKIETTIAAPRDGVVAEIRCAVGDAVTGGQVLVELAAP